MPLAEYSPGAGEPREYGNFDDHAAHVENFRRAPGAPERET